MATVDITEYQNVATDGRGRSVAAGVEPSRQVQQLTPGVSAVETNTFQDGVSFVRVHTDTTIRIEFGSAPSADATSQRMVANSTEYFGVTPGIKASVIASA